MSTDLETNPPEKSAQVRNSWRLWCRLCAKNDPQGNINIFIKDEQQNTMPLKYDSQEISVAAAIEKYFFVPISREGMLPQMLCTDCFSLITTLINFTERVSKVQSMFDSLQSMISYNNDDTIETNYRSLLLQYGLLNDESVDETQRFVSEVHYFESTPKVDELEEKVVDIGQFSKKNDTNPLDMHDVLSNSRNSGKDTDLIGLSAISDELLEKTDLNQDDINGVKETGRLINSQERIKKMSTKPCKQIKTVKKFTSGKLKIKDRNTQTIYSCKKCAVNFERRFYYLKHMKEAHGEESPPIVQLQCPKCPRLFNKQYQLDSHARMHLPDDQKYIIPCPHCDKKFSTNRYVQDHIKYIHINERPFVCEECGIRVRTFGELKSHMITNSDETPFQCEICQKRFKDRARLKLHTETHDPKKHDCEKCGMQLNSRVTLNRHLLVHSDKMQHKCDYCGREFKRVKTLKNHLILHTGLKPYSCDFCERKFASGSNCRTHKKKAHPVELAEQEATGSTDKRRVHKIPKLETLKAVIKNADNLLPVASKNSGNFAFGKSSKTAAIAISDTKNITADGLDQWYSLNTH